MIPKWTLPVTDGARVATDSLLRNTVAAGAIVDVVCLANADENCDLSLIKEKWEINDIFVLRRTLPSSRLGKFFYYFKSYLKNPFFPLTFSSFNEPAIKSQLNTILKTNQYDHIILDGLHLGTPFIRNSRLAKPHNVSSIIYRAHNIETDLWKKASEENPNIILKLLLKHQSYLVEKVERIILKDSCAIAPIAQEDMDLIQEMVPDKKTRLIPLGLNFQHLPEHGSSNLEPIFLFIGKLDWPPNRSGLEWLLQDVWPQVIKNRPNAILKIVGSGNRSWLEKYQYLKGVKIVGFVKNLQDAYQDCHFTIVPMIYGSGTRIKVIESFVMNRRLISTQMGVQGASLRHSDFIQAETSSEWIKILSEVTLDDYNKLQLDNSRKYVANMFCEKKIGAEFYDWIRT